MAKLDPRLGGAATAQTLIFAGLAFAHSVRARGLWRSLLFVGLGMGAPAAAEYLAINHGKALRHHVQPQVRGVPLFAVGGWYLVTYSSYAMIERILADAGLSGGALRAALPAGTAIVATSLDLLADVFGLDQGMWEWRDGGPYAAEVAGPNGQHGVPIENFTSWIALSGGVALVYGLLANGRELDSREGGAGSARAGRGAALLLLPQYLGAAAWANRERKWRYLVYSGVFALALGLALRPASRYARTDSEAQSD